MSLLGTLAKVAIGVAVAKGVSSIVKGQTGGSRGQVGTDGRYRGQHSPGLDDVMKDVFGTGTGGGGGLGGALGGGQASSDPFGQDNGPLAAPEPRGGTSGGGLGDILEQMGKITQAQRGSVGGGGGLGDVIGQLGKAAGGGGLGDILGGILGGAAGGAVAGGASKGFGDLLNEALGTGGQTTAQPSAEQEVAAGLMLRAMLQAAKSDGRIDENEKQKLLQNLGDATDEEKNFVNQELRAPIDIPGLCAQVPQGLQPQIYAISLTAIDLDSKAEAQYLDGLARGLGLSQQVVNQIHSQMGAPPLYS